MPLLNLTNYSIKLRLWLILFISGLCILLILGGALHRTYENVSDVRKLMVRQQTSTALTLIEHYYQLEQIGELSRETAQYQAKEAVKKLRYRDVEYFWINDISPKMIMHPIQTELDNQDLTQNKDPNGLPIFIEFAKVAQTHANGGYVPYMWPKVGHQTPVNKISYVRLFKPWGWIVGTGVYTDEVMSEFLELSQPLILTSGLLFILMIALTYLVVRSIRRPLGVLTQAMHNISQGEGDLTQRLPVQGQDELSEISQYFNEFVAQIQGVVSETQQTVEQLTALSQTVVETCHHTSELSHTQLKETEQSATASNEMTSTIQEVARHAEQAASSARNANENSQQGLNVMQNTQERILALAASIQASSHNINELREQSTEIGTVLHVIQEIAEQTNLLALNAAIEAARAGDAGRGFAVVADEVRNLASRSQQSTEEINQIINKLQEKALASVTAMDENVIQSEQTAESAADAMIIIQEVSQSANQITEMNLSIASAVEEQGVAAEEISKNIVEIADASHLVSDNMESTTQSVGRLQNHATALRQLVERFKI